MVEFWGGPLYKITKMIDYINNKEIFFKTFGGAYSCVCFWRKVM